MATFYQLRNDSRCIMVEAVCYWQENDTMYCVHFQGGDYMEMRSAEFNEFIKDYYEVKLTRDEYNAKFCKPVVNSLHKGRFNIMLNRAYAELETARFDAISADDSHIYGQKIKDLTRLMNEILRLKFNL